MPHRSLLAFLLLLSVPAVLSQPASERIDTLAEQYHEVGLLNGAVLVAQGDDVLLAEGYGEANMEWNIPVTTQTRFRIGSITKQFTAALILQLMEEGTLELDAPLTRYLPDYPAAQGDRVTVRHLLAHTSGIPNYTSLPGFMTDMNRDPYAPDSFLSVFSGLPLEFEPGSAYAYSNSGYFLLGVIIEKLTGMPYDDALHARLLDPLRLDDTGYDHHGDVIEHRAAGYERVGTRYENATYLDMTIPYAAGSMYSTVGDLHRWTRALHAGEVFQHDETLTLMTTPVLQDYGLGLGIGEVETSDGSTPVIQHGGGINGFRTILMYFPEQEYTVAVLDNTAQNASQVGSEAARLLYGLDVSPPKQSIADAVMEAIEQGDTAAGIARYRSLKANSADDYLIDENQLNGLGYFYLGEGDVDTALEIFKLNVEMYPEAWNPHDSLGEAYAEAGDTEQAIVYYRKALDLNPASASARAALKRLGAEVEEETISVEADVLESYTGDYELRPGFVLTVTREDDKLFAQATGQPQFEIIPLSQTEFYPSAFEARLIFHPDASGTVDRLTLRQGGQDVPGMRVRD